MPDSPTSEQRDSQGQENASAQSGQHEQEHGPRRRHRRHHHHHHHHHHRRCPYCGSEEVKRSRRRGFTEILLLPILLRRPFKCVRCLRRFYGFSMGARTLRRALLGLVLIVLTLGMLRGVWSAINYLSSKTPSVETPRAR